MAFSNQDFAEIVERLHDPDPRQCVLMLAALRDQPTGDRRLLPLLEDLLHNDTPVLISIPFQFGEVRWAAAYALAAEYRKLGITRKVAIQHIPMPISANDLALLAQAHDVVAEASGIEGQLEAFAILRELGLLKRYDLSV